MTAVAAPPARPHLVEARATTRRVARTFSLACRLLPRAVRADVYLLYLVFRTLDDLVDDRRPDAAARIAAVDAWARGRAGERTREVELLDGPRHAPPAPARRRWPTSARACAGTSPAAGSHPRRSSTRTATAWPAPSGS